MFCFLLNGFLKKLTVRRDLDYLLFRLRNPLSGFAHITYHYLGQEVSYRLGHPQYRPHCCDLNALNMPMVTGFTGRSALF
jgi:hypothetical protein